jgi:hypothetical protein
MLFIEEVWTTQVDEQGFKGLGNHSKYVYLNGLQLIFPLLIKIGDPSRL